MAEVVSDRRRFVANGLEEFVFPESDSALKQPATESLSESAPARLAAFLSRDTDPTADDERELAAILESMTPAERLDAAILLEGNV